MHDCPSCPISAVDWEVNKDEVISSYATCTNGLYGQYIKEYNNKFKEYEMEKYELNKEASRASSILAKIIK